MRPPPTSGSLPKARDSQSAAWRQGTVHPHSGRSTRRPSRHRSGHRCRGGPGRAARPAAAGLRRHHGVARAAGVPTLAVSHGTVFGCVTRARRAGWPGSTTSSPPGAVQHRRAGHLARPSIGTRPGPKGRARRQCIAYAGSIGRFHHGEQGDKGFLLWELGPDGWTVASNRLLRNGRWTSCSRAGPTLDQLREAASAQEPGWRQRAGPMDSGRRGPARGGPRRHRACPWRRRRCPARRADRARGAPCAPGISQLVSLADKVRAWSHGDGRPRAAAAGVPGTGDDDRTRRTSSWQSWRSDAGAKAQAAFDPAEKGSETGPLRDGLETAPEQRLGGAQPASPPTTTHRARPAAGGMPCNHSLRLGASGASATPGLTADPDLERRRWCRAGRHRMPTAAASPR